MTLENLHTYDHYGYALVAVLGTFGAVLTIHWLMHGSPWAKWVRSLHGVVPPFINIIGVLFGLTLAFLANDTWNAHDRAVNAVFKESDGLRSLMALTANLDGPLGQGLRSAITDYAASSAAEWSLLAERRISADVNLKGDALLQTLSSRRMAEAAGPNVQALMLRMAIDLRDERNSRIALSQTHVNPLKWLGMAFLGLLTLISVAVVHAENPRASLVAITLFALAAAPTAAIVLIQGNPFQQPFSVSPAPIIAAVQVS